MSYRDKFYSKYASAHAANLYGSEADGEAQYSAWDWYFGEFLPEDKSAEILDAGCGQGGFVKYLYDRDFKNSKGIDISPEQVAAAKKQGIRGVELGNLSEFLPKNKNKYDLIFARDVLEHFSKNEALGFAEDVFGSLKAGGAFVIQTVNAENLLWGRLRHGDFTHELAFTKESVGQLLRVAGFKDISVFSQRPVPHGIVSAARAGLWMIFEYFLRAYLLVETGSGKGIFTQNLIVSAKK